MPGTSTQGLGKLHRLIAAVLVSEGKVVQTKHFKITNIVGDVKTAVKFFAKWDVDEILMIDISRQPWPGMRACLEEAAKNVFIPITVGGHIASIETIAGLLRSGADRVLVRRHLWEHPEFASDVAAKFGSQVLVAGVDWVDQDAANNGDERHWLKTEQVRFAQRLEELGAGEILFNSQAKDGTKEGFDIHGIAQVASNVKIPVVAMGGAGEPWHFVKALQVGADAVAAGNLFHYSEHATVKAKKAMKAAGWPVRDAVL